MSESASSSGAARDALRECEEMSLLIEINSAHLERLRNNSSRSAPGGGTSVSDLTRQEIRTMEGKLVKHFSKQASHSAGKMIFLSWSSDCENGLVFCFCTEVLCNSSKEE